MSEASGLSSRSLRAIMRFYFVLSRTTFSIDDRLTHGCWMNHWPVAHALVTRFSSPDTKGYVAAYLKTHQDSTESLIDQAEPNTEFSCVRRESRQFKRQVFRIEATAPETRTLSKTAADVLAVRNDPVQVSIANKLFERIVRHSPSYV